MELIIGGAFQGKLDYARTKYSLDDTDIFICGENGGIDFTKRCVAKLDEFVLWCVRNGEDAVELFKAHSGEIRGSVFICRDIFCGVVPIDAEMRAWREATGRLCAYLSGEAENVTRIFCGLAQILK